MRPPLTLGALVRMNADYFPESSNCWDSLGEVNMVAGDNEQAISCYEKAVALEPRNRNAAEKLAELRGEAKE